MRQTGAMSPRNDSDLIAHLLEDPGTWAIVGLSNDASRDAWRIAQFLVREHDKTIIPLHPKAEAVHGAQGYARLSDIPDGTDVFVVDCFVNSSHVGAVVDEAIANKDRLQINAIWMQRGVKDEEAAARARAAGLGVVMDTCPKIEYPKLRPRI